MKAIEDCCYISVKENITIDEVQKLSIILKERQQITFLNFPLAFFLSPNSLPLLTTAKANSNLVVLVNGQDPETLDSNVKKFSSSVEIGAVELDYSNFCETPILSKLDINEEPQLNGQISDCCCNIL